MWREILCVCALQRRRGRRAACAGDSMPRGFVAAENDGSATFRWRWHVHLCRRLSVADVAQVRRSCAFCLGGLRRHPARADRTDELASRCGAARRGVHTTLHVRIRSKHALISARLLHIVLDVDSYHSFSSVERTHTSSFVRVCPDKFWLSCVGSIHRSLLCVSFTPSPPPQKTPLDSGEEERDGWRRQDCLVGRRAAPYLAKGHDHEVRRKKTCAWRGCAHVFAPASCALVAPQPSLLNPLSSPLSPRPTLTHAVLRTSRLRSTPPRA